METNTTPKAVLIGFDRLQNYLEKQASTFDTIKIANTHNDKTNWRKEFHGTNASNLIASLIDYLNEWTPEGAPYTWYICLFKGKTQIERFPFSKVPAMAGVPAVANNGLTPELVQQLVEAERRAAVAEMQLNIMAQNDLEDDEDDEDDQPDYMGAILQQVQPHIPALIEGIIGMVQQKPLQVAGTQPDDEIMQVVSELMSKGITIEHLRKLNAMPKLKIQSLLAML